MRWKWLPWGLILGIFLVTRLVNLGQMAIFSDEALYLRWAQVMHEQGFWEEPFISLRDGKEPLHPWLLYLAFPLFDNLVVAGRVVSVVTGLGTVVMVWLLTRELGLSAKCKVKSAKLGRSGSEDEDVSRSRRSSMSGENRGEILRSALKRGLRMTGKMEVGGYDVAFWAVLVYVLLPFPLVYDRLAVIDSLLSLTCAMTMWGLVRLAKEPGWKNAGLAGWGLGLGLLTKSIARIWLPLVVVTPWWLVSGRKFIDRDSLLRLKRGRALDDWWRKLRWMGMVLMVAGLVNLPFWLSAEFGKVAGKNAIFMYSLGEWRADVAGVVWKNLSLTGRWLTGYYGAPLVVLVGGVMAWQILNIKYQKSIIHVKNIIPKFFTERSLGDGVKVQGKGGSFGLRLRSVKNILRTGSGERGLLWLGAWIGWPVLVEVLVARIYFPRYFLFTAIPMAIIAGYGLSTLISSIKYQISKIQIKYRRGRLTGNLLLGLGVVLVAGLILGWPAYLSFWVVKKVEAAPLPQIERWQLLESWPAGYGLKEAVEFLRGESRKQPIVVASEDIILLTHGLPLYLEGEDDIDYQILRISGNQVNQEDQEFGELGNRGAQGKHEDQIIGRSGGQADQVSKGSRFKPVFLVTTLVQEEPRKWGVPPSLGGDGEVRWQLVAEWPKVGGKEALRVWKRSDSS
jgi:hypothetical protein